MDAESTTGQPRSHEYPAPPVELSIGLSIGLETEPSRCSIKLQEWQGPKTAN